MRHMKKICKMLSHIHSRCNILSNYAKVVKILFVCMWDMVVQDKEIG